MRLATVVVLLGGLGMVACQQIKDMWETTWDKRKLFAYSTSDPPITFGTPGATGSADIVVDDSTVYQTIYGFGASLTDASALLFNNLKSQNPSNYWQLMDYLFNITLDSKSAGFEMIRVPLGATDFSNITYSFADTVGDTNLDRFDMDSAPDYVFSTLKDILSINPDSKIVVVPWSVSGWMKDGTMNGGTLNSKYNSVVANYLLKSVQGFQNKGISIYGVSPQNEPKNDNPTYPTCVVSVSDEVAIGIELRSLLDKNGFSNVKIYGCEHNWADVESYAIPILQQASNAFDGTSYHCYEGTASDLASIVSQFPNKEVISSECSGTIGSDWWSDIKWLMNSLIKDSVDHGSSTVLMWNLALDSTGGPELPGSDSCTGGCRGVVQINSDGTWSVNQEFYAMAQSSKAVVPNGPGGQWGKRIGVSVQGGSSWALVTMAFVTGGVHSTDQNRYSIATLNWNDGGSNPQPIKTTIEFRGKQATLDISTGVTTLHWYA